MGEAKKWLGEPSFNRSVKLKGGDERLTSDAGALLLREADHRLGLTESLARRLFDPPIRARSAMPCWSCSANACTPWGKATTRRMTSINWRTIRRSRWRFGIGPASKCSKSGWPVSPRSRG